MKTCYTCSASHLQFCSQNEMEPAVALVDRNKDTGLCTVKCSNCGKVWKTRARYVAMLTPVTTQK